MEPDELHVMHLGVGQELLGSVLWYLAFSMMAGDAMSNMHAVWADTQYATQWGNLQRRLGRLGSQRLVVAERWHQVGAEGRHEKDIIILSKLTVGNLRGWNVANKRVWPRVDHRKTTSIIGFVHTSSCKKCWNTSSSNGIYCKANCPKLSKNCNFTSFGQFWKMDIVNLQFLNAPKMVL